jgi:rhodanese-related sulfurtransferase
VKSPVTFSNATANPNAPNIEDVTAEELKEKAASVHVIDVRRPDEYTGELGHIAGAKLVTLNTLPQKLDELPKDGTIVFVCLAGGRSTQAAAFARENGFKHVYNMSGGMLRWNQLGFPVEK